MIKAIIFDYDGIIVDSFPAVHKVYRIMCAKLGKKCPATLAEFKEMYGKSSRVFRERAGFTEEEIKKSDEIYLQEIKKQEVPFFLRIKPVLQHLAERYRLFLLSSSPQEDVELKLRQKGLTTLFVEIIGGTLGPIRKVPLLMELLRKNNLKKDEVVMIGDRINDYEDAQKAGISKIILVEYGWGYDAKAIPGHRQKVLVKKSEDIIKAIKSLH